MNSYARRMVRDGRNPYGSRGGYVTSRDPRRSRRDRGEYDEPDYMDSRYERADGHYHREYDEYPHEEMRGSFELDRRHYGRDMDYDCDYDDMRDYRGRGRMGRGMRGDYGDDYDDMRDMRGRRRNSRGQFMRDRRDYGEDDDDDYRLTKRDIKEWERDMENSDGTRGAHFEKEMIDQKAMQMGIDPKKYGEGVLCVITNMYYSDYCAVAKKFGVDRIEFYIEMAKAFLEDKDFDGDGAEKAFIYFKAIVEHE